MGKALIITEKPSVARDFARVLNVTGRQDGYIENNEYVITWCVGHLVEMLYPESYDEKYKKWRLEDLPFLPKEYKYGVIEAVAKQYDIVHGMLMREDIERVYWAGDAGKEGQTIEENIRFFGGVREGMEELRVWIDSQTDEEILRGIREARPMSDYASLGQSGIMRTIEDYAMGINFSRVMSVKYGNLLNRAAGTESYTAIAVGRVMTCVLGMVVIREREIRNFVETPFYRIVGDFAGVGLEGEWKAVEGSKYFESPLLYKENGFKKEEDALNLISALEGKEAKVLSLETGTSKKKAPLLFNLAELQAECSKRFKISPDETLQVVQDLYEKKLTTYPRTDARVLSSAVAKEIAKNVGRLKYYEPVSEYVETIMNNKWCFMIGKSQYVDDSKITDHYAIIPTGQLTELKSLNELQRKVFDLIVRRFLSIFYPPAVYENVKLVIDIDKEQFFANGKVLKEAGYLEVMGKNIQEKDSAPDAENGENGEGNAEEDENKNQKLLKLASELKAGDPISVETLGIKEGKTNPPKRYTSGSMVLAMENAGQLIEDEELRAQIKGSGIGTSATRAEIIKKLVRIGYLNLNKRTQILTPEQLGEMVFEVVSLTVPALLNPKMTASWEKGLDGITNKTVDYWDYRTKLEKFIHDETVAMIGNDIRDELSLRIQPLIDGTGRNIPRMILDVNCPACGEKMCTTPFGYGCSAYKKDGSGCGFNVGTIANRNLTQEEFLTLMREGKTPVLDGFVSKAKKKFSAALVLQKNEEGVPSIQFDFAEVEPEYLDDVACPFCGGRIHTNSVGFVCEHNDRENPESCKFFVGTIAGKTLTQTQLKDILTKGSSGVIRGFTSKAGKKFDASLVAAKNDEGQFTIQFDFTEANNTFLEGITCPNCGGKIRQTSFGFVCEHNERDNAESCPFIIGTIAGKQINLTQLKELLEQGKTSTIRGFTSKNKKKFDACLKLDKDENGKVSVNFDFEDVEAKKVKDVVCPLCGGDIVVTPFGYGCSNYDKEKEDSCRFMIGKIAGVKLKELHVKQLLTDGITESITGFKSKAGKKFNAQLKMVDGQVQFFFPDAVEPVECDVLCPVCEHKLLKGKWSYECACGFKANHTVAGLELTDEIANELFKNKRTINKVEGFKAKSGNLFDAWLTYSKEDGIKFSFDEPAVQMELSMNDLTGNAKPEEVAPAETASDAVNTTADETDGEPQLPWN